MNVIWLSQDPVEVKPGIEGEDTRFSIKAFDIDDIRAVRAAQNRELERLTLDLEFSGVGLFGFVDHLSPLAIFRSLTRPWQA